MHGLARTALARCPQKKLMDFQLDIVSRPSRQGLPGSAHPSNGTLLSELLAWARIRHFADCELVQDIQTSQGRCRGPGREALGVDLDDVKGQTTGRS